MRTPLTPVVTAVAMLQERPELPPGVRETLAMVRRNVELEARLIDDLLDLTRITKGKVELRKQRVDLCALIHSAVEVCRPEIAARELDFRIELGADAPCWVEADAARLQQVIWNLLKNAVKFTSPAGRVRIRCHPAGEGSVIMEVCDNGIGIVSEVLPRVFNAFEQTERTITRQFGGVGLGLAISKALVEMHGGTIEAASEGKGLGATFRVTLPLAAVPLSAAGGEDSTVVVQALPRIVRSLRILLVEDHDDTANILREVLEADGHEVQRAVDVATALELARSHPFDLLISDLGLPDGSGQDLMRALRSSACNMPGIVLSGYGQDEDIQRSRAAGFAEHLIKPADPDRLAEAITRVTDRSPA